MSPRTVEKDIGAYNHSFSPLKRAQFELQSPWVGTDMSFFHSTAGCHLYASLHKILLYLLQTKGTYIIKSFFISANFSLITINLVTITWRIWTFCWGIGALEHSYRIDGVKVSKILLDHIRLSVVEISILVLSLLIKTVNLTMSHFLKPHYVSSLPLG